MIRNGILQYIRQQYLMLGNCQGRSEKGAKEAKAVLKSEKRNEMRNKLRKTLNSIV